MVHGWCGTLEPSVCTATHLELCNSNQKLTRFACVAPAYRVSTETRESRASTQKVCGLNRWPAVWLLMPLSGLCISNLGVPSLWLESSENNRRRTITGIWLNIYEHFSGRDHFLTPLWLFTGLSQFPLKNFLILCIIRIFLHLMWKKNKKGVFHFWLIAKNKTVWKHYLLAARVTWGVFHYLLFLDNIRSKKLIQWISDF